MDATAAHAQRADRAADLADRRARDADRIGRWTVGVALAVALAMFGGIGTMVYQVAELASGQAALADQVSRLADQVSRLTP